MIACSRCGKNLNDKSRICITCLEECCEDVDKIKQQRDGLLEACKALVDAGENHSKTNETITKFGQKILGIIIPIAEAAIAKATHKP